MQGLHERVIDRDNKDLAGILELVTGNVAWDVGVGACWREGSRNSNDETFAGGEFFGEIDLVAGGVLEEINVRNSIALLNL